MHQIMLRSAWVVASFIVMIASASNGQVRQAQSKTARTESTTCELHVWPTDKFAVTENLGGASYGLIGALMDDATRLKSPEKVAEQFKTQLSPTEQERIIKEVDLITVFHLTGYRVVMESAASQPIWTLEQMKSKQRISNSTVGCYAEMAIISQQYFRQMIGTRLRTYISYKEYGSSIEPMVKILDATATKASDFPAKSGNGIAASTLSLQNAFRENLFKFATDKLKR